MSSINISLRMVLKLIFTLYYVSGTASSWGSVVLKPLPDTIRRVCLASKRRRCRSISTQHHRLNRSTTTVSILLSLKSNEATTRSSDASGSLKCPPSDTSIKVRAMASFISMSLLQAMLAAGIPIDKIISNGMTPSYSPSDIISEASDNSNLTEDEETSITTQTLHQKEGDRIVSMKDNFDTDNTTAINSSATAYKASIDNKDGEVIGISSSNVMPGHRSFSTPSYDAEEQIQLLIPNVPPEISTAFGRPLPIIREHVPPLQRALASRKTISPQSNDTNIPSDIAGIKISTNTASNIMVGTTTKDMKIVTDEDPYGE